MAKAKKCRKVQSRDVGRWVTVKWDDCGRVDSLLIEVEDKGGRVYEPMDGQTHSISLDQVVEIRDYVVPA